jgi:hypothetical protein
MHFDKGQLPPVDGFWSLTMYNAEFFFVANPATVLLREQTHEADRWAQLPHSRLLRFATAMALRKYLFRPPFGLADRSAARFRRRSDSVRGQISAVWSDPRLRPPARVAPAIAAARLRLAPARALDSRREIVAGCTPNKRAASAAVFLPLEIIRTIGLLLRSQFWRSPTNAPFPASSVQTNVCALPQHRAFEFGKRSDHLHHHASGRRGGIDRLG